MHGRNISPMDFSHVIINLNHFTAMKAFTDMGKRQPKKADWASVPVPGLLQTDPLALNEQLVFS